MKKKQLYFCVRCKSIVRHSEVMGESIAGKCNCTASPSPWVLVDDHFSNLAPQFRPGGTALPKSITLLRGLLPNSKNVSPEIAESLLIYLDAAYERLTP